MIRNAFFRTWYGLIFWMRARQRQLRAVKKGLSFVVVEPVFARLKARNHRMPARVKMLGSVLARRIIAATYVPAFGAAPQVQPPSAARQSLDAAISAWLYSRIDSPNVSVLFLHGASPIESCLG